MGAVRATSAGGPSRPPTGEPRPRPALRAVAVPVEHGGWGLTAEPVLLGLLVAPSLAGAALGVGAFVAFLARTPLKVALGDRRRGRRLPRTVLAERVVAAELALLAALAALAWVRAGAGWWIPVLVAAPLFGLELAFDVRARGRRLLPELAGTVGMGGVCAAIVLAGGDGRSVAFGLWSVVAARAVASVPYVRARIATVHGHAAPVGRIVALQVAAAVVVGVGVAVEPRVVAGFVAVVALGAFQAVAVRRPPVRAAVLGARQLVLGLTVVLVTALGVLAP